MKNKLLIAVSYLALSGALHAAPLDIADTPIFVNSAVPPLNLLVMAKDHKLYYEAYSDNSDLDGDDVIDVGYKPEQIDYFGYFNSNVCYTHSDGKFTPSSTATNKKCSGKWSGDFLNYLATSRMDALRKVLYGGYRSVDEVNKSVNTVLQAAYIPQDGHSWGKEYDPLKDSYKINDYAPLADPAPAHRHLFAVTTDIHKSDAVPSLKVLTNTKFRIWEWVSKEAPVARDMCWGNKACIDNGPSADWTMIPESVFTDLKMTTWRTKTNSQPTNEAGMNTRFNSRSSECGSSSVDSIHSRVDSNNLPIRNNNNIFANQNRQCNSDRLYIAEVKGYINIQQTGSYKIKSVMNGSLDMKIGSQWFRSYDGDSSADIYLTAGKHEVSLRYFKGRVGGGEDYWQVQWVPVENNFKSTMTHYPIKVEVCPSNPALREDNCQSYANSGNDAVYKPTGLLHDFGADDKMYFGLLTGSYEKHLDGGVLRNNIASFTHEIDPKTGQFKSDYKGVVDSINNLKLYGFNGGGYDNCGLILDKPLDEKSDQKCYMWGNPVAEMMYEGLRYYSGATAALDTYKYTDAGSVDAKLNLQQPSWESPYRKTKGGYPNCSKPVMTVISDITPSYDYNVPGSNPKWGSSVASDPNLAKPLDVSYQVNKIWEAEGGGSRNVFIGESGGLADYAPSAKTVTNLSTVRGLSPEEPSKKGTYYSAGIARFGATEGINADAKTNNKMMTYAVALASPLPQIKFPTGSGGFVTLVPFGKSVAEYGINTTGPFQPTLTIVDFYVQELANMDPAKSKDNSVNGGRPYAQFRINYEDVEQGNDHDMDAIVLYTIYMNEQNKLVVKLDKEYEAAGIVMHMGYIISGTKKDGIYLEVKSKDSTAYKLNTPPGKGPGECANTSTSNSACILPEHTTRVFEPASTEAAQVLADPLWYAAKYGMPNRESASVIGDPDNYFLVTNALTLKDQLTKAFNDILQKNAAVTRPAVGKAPESPSVTQGRSLYRTEFDAEKWTGSVVKETLDLGTNLKTQAWVTSIPSSRNIKIATQSGDQLTNFSWSNLENITYAGKNVRDTFNINEAAKTDDNGEKRVEYIGGARTGEGTLFRVRDSLLGDIVNSSPVLVSGAQYVPYLADGLYGTTNYAEFASQQATKTPMLYVGANDGMLHGFDATTGQEKFAFIPTPVLENLYLLTQKTYGVSGEGSHKFYVDGALHVSDVYVDGAWKTILIGALGAGGRGIYALDVTDPENIELLWEFTEDSAGSKNSPDGLSDLGYTFGNPMVVKLNNDQWVVALNSGYNSPNAESGVASLFLLDVSTGAVVKKLDAKGAVTNNGLSSVRIADYTGNGKADYAYAGDIQGNLWRFDLKANNPDDYSVGYGEEPMFKAGQAITAAPNITRHPTGIGYLIAVGTGRYLASSDKVTPFNMQTLYGLWDKYTKGEATITSYAVSKSTLLEQSIFLKTTDNIGDDDKKITRDIALLTNHSPVWTGSNANQGWKLDLKEPGSSELEGERVVDDMIISGKVLLFKTRTPSTDPCESGVAGFTYGINPLTGGRLEFNVFDLNSNLVVGNEDGYMYEGKFYPISGYGSAPGGFTVAGGDLYDSSGDKMKIKVTPADKNRESWFVIPKELAEP